MNRKRIIDITIFALFLVVGFPAMAAAENWQFEAEIAGIKTYYRTVEGSDYRAFKATGTFDVTMAALGGGASRCAQLPRVDGKARGGRGTQTAFGK